VYLPYIFFFIYIFLIIYKYNDDDDYDEACAVIKIMHALTNQVRTYSQQTSAKKHD